VLKTQGNFNNEIGLPLTIFNLDSMHEAAVIEMGMSGFGEISRLTAVAKPDIAVITNIGLSHIEKLGSRNNILKAKLEILEGLSKDGLVVLNGDDDLLSSQVGKLAYRTVSYGINGKNDYQAADVENLGENGTRFNIELENNVYRVYVPVPGIHNVYNALAAIAVGIELGVPMDRVVDGIKEFSPGKMRLNIINSNGIKIINDTYNASPNSMEAAINVLLDIKDSGRSIAVLGDMLEMGEWAPDAHAGVGKYAIEKGIDYIITVGKNAAFIAKGALEAGAKKDAVITFEKNISASDFLKRFLKNGDVVLVKGSRGMKMEQIVDALQ
jgi:UDP-N-acetylmuramoyl-tripeptide--D-alanyl-D-alanine ligase